jgi:hypothetical protein
LRIRSSGCSANSSFQRAAKLCVADSIAQKYIV